MRAAQLEDLSEQELQFLESQRIDCRWVYVRSVERTKEAAIEAMRCNDKWVLHGFRPCSCGVSLRSRKGDCLYCHRKQLEHVWRYTEAGSVYILASLSLNLIKVGSTEFSPAQRAENLNKKGYAGTSDWIWFYSSMAKRRGLLEDRFKSELGGFAQSVPYTDLISRKQTYSRETYAWDWADAVRVLDRTRRDYLKLYRLWLAG